jgi:D-alanyl-D-alanine carboxypeptidase
MVPPKRIAMVAPASPRKATTATAAAVNAASWSIQVGAYATRQATEQAIQQAIKRAPQLLRHATAVITALPQQHGTVYRARLSGLEPEDARKACHLLSHCLTVPPGAS